MTRDKTAQLLAGASAVAFVVAAALHASGYRTVVTQVERGFSGMGPLMAALWLAFSAALLVFGAIVGLVALGRVNQRGWILSLAGCFPLITVLLQLSLLGFTRSTAVLATVAIVTFGAAVASRGAAGPAGAGGA